MKVRKNRILLYSWLHNGTYHKNLAIWKNNFKIWWIWVISWKRFSIGHNHIFQVKIWQKFTSIKNKQHKKPTKERWPEPSQGREKGGGQRKAKRGRELIFLMVKSYPTHGPSYVTNMQIVRSNNSGRSRTSITYQC